LKRGWGGEWGGSDIPRKSKVLYKGNIYTIETQFEQQWEKKLVPVIYTTRNNGTMHNSIESLDQERLLIDRSVVERSIGGEGEREGESQPGD
jgi:hypothetical protein